MVERLEGPEPLHLILPAYRPQEIIHIHACEAVIRTVNRIEASPVTGAPVQFVICGGDNADNAQWNELRMFFELMNGWHMTADTGGHGYEGVASLAWNDPAYWQPDSPEDDYKRRWGFPAYPGVLETASEPFDSHGCRFPWLSTYGNHDGLVIGTALRTPEYEEIVLGSRKAYALPPGFDPIEQLGIFIMQPEVFLSGPAHTVAPDSHRRTLRRREFLDAHLHTSGKPAGHGFSEANLRQDRAYYVCDAYPHIRLIVLDTTNPGGHYQGSMGAGQLRWLEERLAEVHSRYDDEQGRTVETTNEDRLVVICSHHGLSMLINPLIPHTVPVPDEDDLPRLLRPDVERVLHRFPNVVLLINGHTHRNQICPRPDPAGKTAGFWEVTTSSLIDWPSQGRLIELVSNADNTLSIFCTMIDYDAPLDPREADGFDRLVSLHRELAANDPFGGIARGKQGQPEDRTVELVLPAPFPL
jgi:metallophosphoesterase (TIGR03767 family)